MLNSNSLNLLFICKQMTIGLFKTNVSDKLLVFNIYIYIYTGMISHKNNRFHENDSHLYLYKSEKYQIMNTESVSCCVHNHQTGNWQANGDRNFLMESYQIWCAYLWNPEGFNVINDLFFMVKEGFSSRTINNKQKPVGSYVTESWCYWSWFSKLQK